MLSARPDRPIHTESHGDFGRIGAWPSRSAFSVGYTTFSSFGWETAKMLEDGELAPRIRLLSAPGVIAGLFAKRRWVSALANQL